MPKSQTTITLKELHDQTGDLVRRAAAARKPISITDHGAVVAVLSNPALVRSGSRTRTLLPDFAQLMLKSSPAPTQADLDVIRADR